MKYFENVSTIEDLREQYKKLAFKFHPDKGGDLEAMQAINSEYDILFAQVQHVHKTADGRTYTKEQTGPEIPDEFREIINDIINFDCTIEICGAWIWVYNAYPYRKELKELGFFWCSKKVAWAWSDAPKTNKHKLTLEEIRKLYGSEIIKENEKKRQLGAAL